MPKKETIHTQEYIRRINLICDYIEKHIDKAFTLDELAEIACFSKFHFHRIFQGMLGETPFQFITRVRLEKAANQIVMHPKESISEIAYRVGFSDMSIFSRNFKQYFGQTASKFRQWKTENSNQSQISIATINKARRRPPCTFVSNHKPLNGGLTWN